MKSYLDNTKEINTIFCYNISFKTNYLNERGTFITRFTATLREKYPNREFFLVHMFLY